MKRHGSSRHVAVLFSAFCVFITIQQLKIRRRLPEFTSNSISSQGSTISDLHLCKENVFLDSLIPGVTLSTIDQETQNWIKRQSQNMERKLKREVLNISHGNHGNSRFAVFEETAHCNNTCSGSCNSDSSKRICGLEKFVQDCIVYSVGGWVKEYPVELHSKFEHLWV